MQQLSYEYIQFLNEKILQYLPASHVKVGDKINLRCPLCGDSHKSATKKRGWIYLKNASFYCFNCSTGMSGIKFLQYISGEAYEDIRKEYIKLCFRHGLNTNLSAQFDVPTAEPSIFQLKSILNPDWKRPLSDKAKTYLDNRLVTKAPFFNDPVYSCYSKKTNDEFILMPWRINGIDAYYQLNDFQKLHSLKYIFPKDKKKLVAGLDNVDISWPYIILFEGYWDSLFVKNGCCVGTKAVTDYQLKLIRERYPHHQIVISFDNDEAGLASMIKLMKSDNDFKYFRWFNQNTKEKDVNDYVIAKNNVNIFSKADVLERMIVDKLLMKMYLLRNGLWK